MSSSKTSTRPKELRVEIQDLLDKSLRHSFPDIDELSDFIAVKGDDDDYVCPNVLTVCEKLRVKDPELFRRQGAKSIAKVIMKELKNSEMLEEVSLRSGCFLCFKLSWDWISERIKNMLDNGIDVWAPEYGLRSAHVEFPTGDVDSKMHGDVIRSEYISLVLKEMFGFSKIKCTVAPVNHQSLSCENAGVESEVLSSFVIEDGKFKENGKDIHLFDGSGGERGFINVDIDLGRLWHASCRDEAHFILYITPVRLRAYVEKCIAVAKDVKWVQDEKSIVACCGYRTSSDEKGKLCHLIPDLRQDAATPSLLVLGEAAGYTMTPDSFFASVVRYTYLSTPRLVEVTFRRDEMLGVNGNNNLVYLLRTKALIRLLIKNPRIRTSKRKLPKVAKERQLGLHIVRFTDVIEKACASVSPHMVCEYLHDLCKKFTSCYSKEVPVESGLWLCRAAEVVMQKCLELLSMNLSGDSTSNIDRFLSEEEMEEMASVSCFNPYPAYVARTENPRLVIFSMYLSIFDVDFEEGNMSGYISVSDDYGLHPDKWSSLFVGDIGHIDYFSSDWYNPLRITNDSSHFFGNPSAPHEVAFSSCTEIHVRLAITKATKDYKDACYEICTESGKLSITEDDKKKCECDTMTLKAKDGLLQIHYILLADALDTTIDIRFESPGRVSLKLRGHVYAYYGDGVLDEKDDSMQTFYKAIIFKTDRARIYSGDQLKLKRSVLSVPVDGCLVIEAFLEDLETGKVIFNGQRELRAPPTRISTFNMDCDKGTFFLKVHWSKAYLLFLLPLQAVLQLFSLLLMPSFVSAR